ncbi:MAG: glycosyltransferase family 9 protein [Agriterribacter sp.]
MQKFLIIQTAFIGDVVLATPLIEKLHAFFPDVQIDFLLRKGNESLFQGHPYLNKVLIWNKKERKYRSLWNLLKLIRKRKYDKLINLQRFGATGFLTAFSGAKEKIGFDKNPFSFMFDVVVEHAMKSDVQSPHETVRNLSLIEHFTDNSIYKPKLYPQPHDYNTVEKYKQWPYICIAPASVWFTKQYPKEKWVSFIQTLPGELMVYLLGAPSEKQLCADIMHASGKYDIKSLAGELTFLQSAALMRDAVMNYVNDSAPMHFASAMNAPVTAVYCSTVPAFGYGPLSDKRYIVEVKENLDCRPCGVHGYKACPLQHFNCAYYISNQQLLETLGEL